VEACSPIRAQVTGDFNVRGGIKTIVRANYFRDENSKADLK
jgi:NADPH-dependent 7-cyano-7-deazaguanine reductase QueF